MTHFLAGCLNAAKFNMSAKILHQYSQDGDITSSPGIDYEVQQDARTGELVRVWSQADPDSSTPTATVSSCYVEGYSRADSYRAKISERYAYPQRVIIHFPEKTDISVADRVTQVKDSSGKEIFIEDIISNGVNVSTTYNVVDVGKIFDISNRAIETVATLERVGIQSA